RAPGHQRLAERAHPVMVLVERLAAAERAPGDPLVDVGPAGVVADLVALDPRPCRRANDLAQLRGDVAEADLLALVALGQVHVVAAGGVAKGLPRLHRYLAVRLRRPAEVGFAGVHVAFDPWPAGGPPFGDLAVEPAQQLDLILRIPVQALAAVAEAVQQRAERGEALVGGRVVALHHGDIGHGPARDRIALAEGPVQRFVGLGDLARRVVLDRRGHQVLLDPEHLAADPGEGLRDAAED